MDHGRISRNTARGLRALRSRVSRARIPAKQIDQNIILATWNIREFGKKRRRAASIHYIAEIINSFSIVSVVELRDNLSDLYRVLEILGPDWDTVFSDFATDRAGNRERVAYVFDRRSVSFTGLAAEADPPKRKVDGRYVSRIEWWRSPFMASFRAGSFDFILISAHIRWGSEGEAGRVAPIQELANWVDKRRRERHVLDKDIILLGDFNIPNTRGASYRAITSKGLRIPRSHLGFTGTNLARNKRYDQILHYPRTTRSFTSRGGIVDFYDTSFNPLYPGDGMAKGPGTYQLSDHLPLWAELDVDHSGERLDQILART